MPLVCDRNDHELDGRRRRSPIAPATCGRMTKEPKEIIMSKSKTVPWQKAQGDLLVEEIRAVPEGFAVVPPDEHGRHVVASGEATGHHHVLRAPGVCQLAREGISDRVVTTVELSELLHDQGSERYVPTLDHAPIALPPGTFRVIRQREWVGQGA